MSLKILTADQIREADAYTIKEEQIASVELMERAAAAFVRAYVKMYDEKSPVLIFCGTGNNGGDGLVIGRMLLSQQYKVQVYIVQRDGKSSADFQESLEKLNKYHEPKKLQAVRDFPEMPAGTVLIDALFGTGLSRPVEGLYADLIRKMNSSAAEIVSVDMPSGLYADKAVEEGDAIIRADWVISFHNPKLAFMLPENGRWIRKWRVVNIGLSKEYMQQAQSPYCFTTLETIRKIYQRRDKWSHKGDYGKVLLLAGSKGKIGASILCARACLRSGVGLLTVYLPNSGYPIMQSSVPEAMVLLDPSEEQFTQAPDTSPFDVLGLGPGLGTTSTVLKAFKAVLEQSKQPMVLDADALNLLSKNNELLDLLPENAILTPHPKEFERLCGAWKNGYERLQKQRAFSRKYGVVLVLKGAHSSITAPDGRVYFNSTGNPGMATGGTGDVLTGMLTGLLGQQYKPFDAAVLGVFLHGLAGDLAAKEMGEEALIASDLINWLSAAYMKIPDPSFSIPVEVYS